MTVASDLGSCFGFAVRSSIPLEYLRAGDGEALEIVAGPESAPRGKDGVLLEWRSSDQPTFHARLHSDGRDYRLWIAHEGWFFIEPGVPRVTLPETNGFRREERLWAVPAALCLLHRGDLALHAAAVEVDGGAILLAASRTFEKTTLAAAFLRAGHRILSDDLSCVRASAGELTTVPGPALLRMRRDVAERVEIPFTHRIAEDDERVHLALDPAMRGDCRPVPARAVVLLRPAEDNVALQRVPPVRAVPVLWALSFRLPTEEDRSRCLAGVADLASALPVWNVSFPRRLGDLASTVERIVADV